MKDIKEDFKTLSGDTLYDVGRYFKRIHDDFKRIFDMGNYYKSREKMQEIMNKTKRLPRKTKKKYKKLGIYEDWKEGRIGYERK